VPSALDSAFKRLGLSVLAIQEDHRSWQNGENVLLNTLPTADLQRIAPLLQDYPLNAGEVLREAGGRIEHVYFPHSGMISLVIELSNGARVETATIGAMSVHTGSKAFSGAIVRLPGRALRITLERFQSFYRTSEAMRSVIARFHVVLLRQVQQLTACNAVHDVNARLSRWLVQSHDHGNGIPLPFTQDFLAQMLGVRRATVTLAAQRLQNDGIINYRHGSIEIIDRAGLERRACECYWIVSQLADSVGGRK
jgi:CRP-like cAMP-binding protein